MILYLPVRTVIWDVFRDLVLFVQFLKKWKTSMEELQPATLLKVTLFHGFFSRFFKLYKWYQIVQRITILCLPWSQLMIINIFFSFIILEALRKLFYWLSDVLYGTTIVSKTSWRCALFQCRFNSVKVKRAWHLV